MGRWIWKFGEFENYHSLRLHNSRQNYGYIEPVVWKQYACEPVVVFRRTLVTEGGEMRITACGDFSVTVACGEDNYMNRRSLWGQSVIELQPGEVTVTVRVSNLGSFPCLFIEGAVETDENWLCDDLTENWEPVGSDSAFCDRSRTPEVFPFEYSPLEHVSKEPINGGVLFDFGRETYGPFELSGLKDESVTVCCGESREEALDTEWSVIHFTGTPENGSLAYPPVAFRYIWVSDPSADPSARYEYLPLERRGSFRCGDELTNRVWDTAAYTFHLNCREFFLDGIKRDHWVWGGDAYQSLFVSRYLFFDPKIEQRTLIALAGKRPFVRHINTIMDYTFFWFLSLDEHYRTYGDREFLRQIFPRAEEIMSYCLSREDDDGFMRGKHDDWVFIDWANMDKTGALCGEQILWAKALECYANLCEVVGKPAPELREKSRKLREKILEKYFDRTLGAFVDSFESGKKSVTRHSNILAYLFLSCDDKIKETVYKNVILNDDVPQITTPYFKFYENQVHCEAGNISLLDASIRDYYGGMLKLGATTFYEEFDTEKTGVERFAMYGRPYEKSLCHAWSAGPVYLLGAYRLGVKNTGVAYSSFDVRPNLDGPETFSGSVPVPGGAVSVEVDRGHTRVLSDIPGGTLWVGGKPYPIPAGEEIVV